MWLHRPWNRCTWHCRRTHKPLCAKWGSSWQTPNIHTFHGHLKSHTYTFSHWTSAVFQDKPAGRYDERPTIHEHRPPETSPGGRYTTRSRDRGVPHTHRFDIRHRLRRVQTRYSRTRRVVRQIQSRNHIWRQQDWPHWRRPTRCAQSIPHRHTQVHHQETRLYLASRTSNHRHHSPQRHHVEGLRRQSTQGPTTRDLRRPSGSIQQSHHQRTATNIPRKAPLGSREDHCQDVAWTC